MKIAFILPYVPSLIRVRPYQLIRELSKSHDVTVLATGTGESRDLAALTALGVRVDVVPLRQTERLREGAIALVRGESLQAAACRSQEMERRLARILEHERPDVVHLEHYRAAYLRSSVPPGVPVLFDSVDCISLLQERTLRSSHSLRQRLVALIEVQRTRAYEARILGQFDRVIATSPEDAAALTALSPSTEVTVVPNGVDLDYFRREDGPRAPTTIVFSGKMSYHANATAALHFVRDILPLVRNSHPEVRFVVAGSAPPPAIQKLARAPGIVVTGHLADLREPLSGATLAVCPVTVKVGIQNKVLEAMAMGLPVVCSAEGAEGLMARPDQDFLVGDSAGAFAQQVVRLLDDVSLRERLGQAGRAYVETHHQWSVAASRIEDLYHAMRENRRGAPSPRA